MLFQNNAGGIPSGELAQQYWEAIDEPSFPVTSDTTGRILDATPYSGSPLPGKCVLSPEMEILDCDTGHNDDAWAFDAIRAHAGL